MFLIIITNFMINMISHAILILIEISMMHFVFIANILQMHSFVIVMTYVVVYLFLALTGSIYN